MGFRIGNGYKGSADVLTSTSNHEVIPATPENWVNAKLSFYKFSFMNLQPCHVKINGGDSIYLDTNQGFECEHIDCPIHSFVIVESGISFQWVGAY